MACRELDEKYCLEKETPKCKTTSKPIDFIYERKIDDYNLDRYKTNNDLIAKIQTGKGDKTFIYYGDKNIYVE